jgi:hypothetical protein
MAGQEPQDTEHTQDSEPKYATLRERHEAVKAQMRAEMEADLAAVDSMSNEELEAMRIKANRKLKPLPADMPDETRNRLKLMVGLMFDKNITVV